MYGRMRFTYIYDGIPMLGASALDEAFGGLDGGYDTTVGPDELGKFREEVRGPSICCVDNRSGAEGSARSRYRDPAVGVAL